MSINAISNATGQDIGAALQSLSTSNTSDSDKIKDEIKNSGSNMNAQQISIKYNVTLSKAEEILEEIQKESNTLSTEQTEQESIPNDFIKSTVAYRA